MRIKELRKKENLTQDQLGEIIGKSGQTILNWENGINEPKISELIKLADFFNVSVDYLIERNDTNSMIENVCSSLRQIDSELFIQFIKKSLEDIAKK